MQALASKALAAREEQLKKFEIDKQVNNNNNNNNNNNTHR